MAHNYGNPASKSHSPPVQSTHGPHVEPPSHGPHVEPPSHDLSHDIYGPSSIGLVPVPLNQRTGPTMDHLPASIHATWHQGPTSASTTQNYPRGDEQNGNVGSPPVSPAPVPLPASHFISIRPNPVKIRQQQQLEQRLMQRTAQMTDVTVSARSGRSADGNSVLRSYAGSTANDFESGDLTTFTVLSTADDGEGVRTSRYVNPNRQSVQRGETVRRPRGTSLER